MLKKPTPLYSGVSRASDSFRNRYQIGSANGLLTLSVPLQGGRRITSPVKEIQIDYTHEWQRQHWGALYSAYGRAPFWEHYGPELEALLYRKYQHLFEFNLASIEWLSKSMKLNLKIEFSNNEKQQVIHFNELKMEMPAYPQVFQERLGFLPDLSAIDLLMAEGPWAGRYLGKLNG
jgi:hypothetical protein